MPKKADLSSTYPRYNIIYRPRNYNFNLLSRICTCFGNFGLCFLVADFDILFVCLFVCFVSDFLQLEGYKEARLWNDIFVFAEQKVN